MAPIVSKYKAEAEAKDAAVRDKIDHEIELRKAQEKDRTRGEPVWFSRHVHNGALHHWCLFIKDQKYELRLPGREKYKSLPQGQMLSSIVPTTEFEARITPWSVKEEMMALRDANLAAKGKPHVSNYYVCQIGWTRLSNEQLKLEWEAVRSQFGVYVLGLRDCQTFVKHFVEKIIIRPEGEALDFYWFAENVATEYQKLQEINPRENVERYQRYLAVSLLGVGSATAGAGNLVASEYSSEEPMKPTGTGQGKGGQNDDGGCCSSCDGCGGC